jgi:hypothetical protein
MAKAERALCMLLIFCGAGTILKKHRISTHIAVPGMRDVGKNEE